MNRSRHFALALGLLATSGACSQQTISVQLHPMQASGDVSFLCRVGGDPKLPAFGTPRPIEECNPASVSRSERDLFALVTQTMTGEIAIVNVPLDPANLQAGEGFVDVASSVPGYNFLKVGARPERIVSTPGGVASFVGVAEVGKPSIFGLPTSCVSEPKPNEYDRSLTTWPACSLPAAPGAMAVVVDPPTADGLVARSCDGSQGFEAEGVSEGKDNSECPADLNAEDGPNGRRKLLVALPDRGTIAVIDAQSVLNRAPGSLQPCVIEAELPLNVTPPVTPIDPMLPDDLLGCGPEPLPTPPKPGSYQSTPSDFDLSGGKLYVSDATAPFVHIVNAEQPCALTEAPPLLTRSFDNPDRVVTTSKIAVSPLAPSGKRYAYAIDQYDWPASSIMMFDVSPGFSSPLPIVRRRSPYLPFEPPDRIQFSGSPRDVTFVLRDRPVVDDVTGNVVVGTKCEPDPRNSDDPGAKYRPAADYSSGARATELRGLFASVLLTSGTVAMVDVEDFDAPCRRPRTLNIGATEDFRGCRQDPEGVPGMTCAGVDPANGCYEVEGQATVTDEVSCQMVQAHRQRSASMGVTNSTQGIHAPSLRSSPQFRPPESAAQGDFRTWPKVLAVEFEGVGPDAPPVPAQVYVNTTLYQSGSNGSNALELAPQAAASYSLTLPFNEPRAYPLTNEQSLVYEGQVTGTLRSGFLETNRQGDPSLPAGVMRLRDPSVGYCDSGVSDPEVMSELGERRFGLSGTALQDFADSHSDYVVITSDFPAPEESYWSEVAASPLERPKCSRSSCEVVFGKFDSKELSPARDFRILDAQQQILSLAPRRLAGEAGNDAALVEQAACCFPSGNQYVVRASNQWVLTGVVSGFRHQVIPEQQLDAQGQPILNCKRDCNPRKHFFESRVFEISQKFCERDEKGNVIDPNCKPCAGDCSVGTAPESQTYCVANDAATGVKLTETAANCIHATTTERLAVYSGATPSVRDMVFRWQVAGGFWAQRVDLSLLSALVSPQTVLDLSQFNWLVVIDGGALGLVQISLDALAPLVPPLN